MKQTLTTRLATQLAKRILITMLCAGLLVFGEAHWSFAPSALGAKQQAYESYYWYLEHNDYPDDSNPGWHENVQGITHDATNWHITQTDKVWKIPVSQNLDDVSCDDPGVACKTFNDWPALSDYNHMGDPEYFGGFIFIPVDEFTDLGGEEPFAPPAIAAIRADTLEYVAHAPLPANTSTAWCAIDPQGTVYASHSTLGSVVNRFRIVWNDSDTLSFSIAPQLFLSVAPQDVQGGVISPSGELLYICAGSLNYTLPSHGISVFDLTNGLRIKQSNNGGGLFSYMYSSGLPEYDEPEGLTIWDLDGGQAPGIRGQLHVLLLNNDGPDDDNVSLKHYTHTIWVDQAYTDFEDGKLETPFNTVVEALNFAWDGTRLSIKGGSYPDLISTSKRVQMTARQGAAIIGQ